MGKEKITTIQDDEWGCHYKPLNGVSPKIKSIIVNVNNVDKMAREMAKSIIDTSWMAQLDKGMQQAYEGTVNKTAQRLTDMFQKYIKLNKNNMSAEDQKSIEEQFGESVVSMGTLNALHNVEKHNALPLSELWKEKIINNPGFDFHTECQTLFINFGEAKFSSSKNPYTDALEQIDCFLEDGKHTYDQIYLRDLVSNPICIENLQNKEFGIIAAFSVNSKNYELILNNASNKLAEFTNLKKAQFIYLVGIICKV